MKRGGTGRTSEGGGGPVSSTCGGVSVELAEHLERRINESNVNDNV